MTGTKWSSMDPVESTYARQRWWQRNGRKILAVSRMTKIINLGAEKDPWPGTPDQARNMIHYKVKRASLQCSTRMLDPLHMEVLIQPEGVRMPRLRKRDKAGPFFQGIDMEALTAQAKGQPNVYSLEDVPYEDDPVAYENEPDPLCNCGAADGRHAPRCRVSGYIEPSSAVNLLDEDPEP